MTKQVNNEKIFGKVYYGLHAAAGVAEYTDPENGENFRILLPETTLVQMDPTMAGCPLLLAPHANSMAEVQSRLNDSVGSAVESFFNPADGRHWVKFVVTDSEADRLIRSGYRLSNGYAIKAQGAAGSWHNVDYDKEVQAGEYNHFILTPHPRYEESVIYTPDEFKKYNEECLKKLESVKNSKGEENMGLLSIFKSEPVDAKGYENLSVRLPKSGKTLGLMQVINDADEKIVKDESGETYADPSHKVKIHDGTIMNVGELLEKHKELSNAHEELKQCYNALEEKAKEKGVELKDEVGPDADKKAKEELLRLAEHEQEEIDKQGQSNNEKIAKLRAELGLKPVTKPGKTPEQIANDKASAQALIDAAAKGAANRASSGQQMVRTERERMEASRTKYSKD